MSAKETKKKVMKEKEELTVGDQLTIYLTEKQHERFNRILNSFRDRGFAAQGMRHKIGSKGIDLALNHYEKLLEGIPEENET